MSSVVRRMVVGECLWCSNKMCLAMNDWLVKNMNIIHPTKAISHNDGLVRFHLNRQCPKYCVNEKTGGSVQNIV